MNALHAERARIVHVGLLNAPDAIWESMGEDPSVSHALWDCTRTLVVPPLVSTVLVVKFQTPKPRRVRNLRGKSKRTASLGRSTWMIEVRTRLITPVRLAFLVPTARISQPFRH